MRTAEFRYNDAAFPAFFKTDCPRVGGRDDIKNPDSRINGLTADDRFDAAAKLCDDFLIKIKIRIGSSGARD